MQFAELDFPFPLASLYLKYSKASLSCSLVIGSMALFFLKNESDGGVKALQVSNGQVINDMKDLEVALPSAETMAKWSRKSLTDILDNLGLKMTNIGKANREKIAEELVKQFSKLQCVAIARSDVHSILETAPSSSTDGAVVVKREHITNSGLRTIVYAKKYQSPVETTGYIITYEQGIPHAMSEEGIYQVDSDFLKSNNCFFPNRDFAESEEEDEEAVSQNNDTTEIEEQEAEASAEVETWTDDNECAYQLLAFLNSNSVIRVNPDEFVSLKKKRAKFLTTTEDDFTKKYSNAKKAFADEGLNVIFLKITTMNFDIGSEMMQVIPMKWTQSTTVSDIHAELKAFTNPSAETQQFRLFHMGKPMLEGFRRVAEYDIKKSDVVNVVPKLSGGGVRKTILKPDRVKTAINETAFKKCYDIVEKCQMSDSVKLEELLSSMAFPDLVAYEKHISHHKSTNASKVLALTEFNGNFKMVEDMIECLTDVKKKMETLVATAVKNDCVNSDGEFRMAELRKNVEVMLKVKQREAQNASVSRDAPMNSI